MRYIFYALVFVSLLAGCSSADRDFNALKTLKRDDPAEAKLVANRLSKNERGVELAIEDFNLFGGQTRGFSSWILVRSPLGGSIDSRLKEIAREPGVSFSRRFEALWIIWERSEFSDTEVLTEIFESIKGPGDTAVMMARRKMLQVLEQPSKEIADALLMPGNVSIEKHVTLDAIKVRLPENKRKEP